MQWAAWQRDRQSHGLPGTAGPTLTSPTGPGAQPIDARVLGSSPPTAPSPEQLLQGPPGHRLLPPATTGRELNPCPLRVPAVPGRGYL